MGPVNLKFFSENFGSEGFDGGAFLPGVEREAGFAAGLFEEGGAVPVVLGGDLGQEQAAHSEQGDEQAVASDFDRFGRNGLRRGEDTEFDFQVVRFGQGYVREASVFESGGAGRAGDGAIDGVCGEDVADASAQGAAQVKRSEGAARLGEMIGWRVEWDLALFERGEDGLVSEAQQLGAFVGGEFAG